MSIAYNGMGSRSHPVSDRNRAKETYSKVTCYIVHRTANAVLINPTADERGDGASWVALSLIHGADESFLNPQFLREPFTFRLMSWKAKELGL